LVAPQSSGVAFSFCQLCALLWRAELALFNDTPAGIVEPKENDDAV